MVSFTKVKLPEEGVTPNAWGTTTPRFFALTVYLRTCESIRRFNPTRTTNFLTIRDGAHGTQLTLTLPPAAGVRLSFRGPSPLGRLPEAVPVGLAATRSTVSATAAGAMVDRSPAVTAVARMVRLVRGWREAGMYRTPECFGRGVWRLRHPA